MVVACINQLPYTFGLFFWVLHQMKSKGLEACLCNCYRCEFLGLLLLDHKSLLSSATTKACLVLRLWKLAQFCNHESLLSSATTKACSVLQLWKLAQFCNYERLLSSATMKGCSALRPWKVAQLCNHERLLSSATMEACQFYGHSPPLCQNLPPLPLELVNTVRCGNKTSDAPFKPFLLSTFGPLLTMFLNEIPHNSHLSSVIWWSVMNRLQHRYIELLDTFSNLDCLSKSEALIRAPLPRACDPLYNVVEVETSASYFSELKLVTDNLSLYLCSQLRSYWNDVGLLI